MCECLGTRVDGVVDGGLWRGEQSPVRVVTLVPVTSVLLAALARLGLGVAAGTKPAGRDHVAVKRVSVTCLVVS